MSLTKLNQQAFTAVEGILILVIVVILGGTGFFVYHANQKTSDTLNKAAQVAQSSPAKTIKKKAAQTSAKAPEDEAADWLAYTNAGNNFSLKLPDGWVLEQNGLESNAILLQFGNKLAITPGAKAVVNKHAVVGKDYQTIFSVQFVDAASDSGSFLLKKDDLGQQQASFTSKAGVRISKYYLLQQEDVQGIGLQKGDQQYTYFIQAGNKVVTCTYSFKAGDTDYHENVEKALQTVTLL